MTLLFGCYRRDEAADPEVYFSAAIAVFSEFTPDIVEYATDARTGLPIKHKTLPAIADIREFCDRIVTSRHVALDRLRRAERQIGNRDSDPPRSQRVIDGFAALSAKMHARHDRRTKNCLTIDELRSLVGDAAFDAIPDAKPAPNWKKP